MAWGFGPAGYAQFRTQRVLGEFGVGKHPSIDEWMNGLRSAAASGPLSGYEYLRNHQVPHLGPSFATKHLYFVSPTSNQSPIIDSVVVGWLWRYQVATKAEPIVHWKFDVDSWNRYIDFSNHASVELQAVDKSREELKLLGFIEYLMFQDELRHRALGGLDSWNR
jgi:hypothetical protein